MYNTDLQPTSCIKQKLKRLTFLVPPNSTKFKKDKKQYREKTNGEDVLSILTLQLKSSQLSVYHEQNIIHG